MPKPGRGRPATPSASGSGSSRSRSRSGTGSDSRSSSRSRSRSLSSSSVSRSASSRSRSPPLQRKRVCAMTLDHLELFYSLTVKEVTEKEERKESKSKILGSGQQEHRPVALFPSHPTFLAPKGWGFAAVTVHFVPCLDSAYSHVVGWIFLGSTFDPAEGAKRGRSPPPQSKKPSPPPRGTRAQSNHTAKNEGTTVIHHDAEDRVTTDGGTPVRPTSSCGRISKAIGEEIRKTKILAKPGRRSIAGEQIREMAKSGTISGCQTRL
ncbi:hypothetical protein Acr_00g0095270 [Actinidia rufa]|uniref:Uncharacterized protein n=1 Tax=Actinidia rufa TaxID=165716 RepID=A0A7J0DYX7_9ERIC|nr:hypothetical protein Acr_00g0095270 [Actinidia rufa]